MSMSNEQKSLPAQMCSRCGYPRTRTACARCLYVETEDRQRLPDTSYEMAAFIGHKGLGEEFTEWAMQRRAEMDRLLEGEPS